MSLTFAVPHAPAPIAGPTEETRIAGTVAGTVDVFDAAAHLEAMGFGERSALMRGYSSTFEHAGTLVDERVAGRAETDDPAHGRDLSGWAKAAGAGIARASVVLCGVLICIGTIAPHTPGHIVFAAGAAGWPVGQAVSAGLWQGLSADDRFRARANALVLGTASFAIVAVLCLTLRSTLPLYWALWCGAVSVPMVLWSMPRVLAVVVPLAAVVGVLMATGSAATPTVSRLAILALALPVPLALLRSTWAERGRLVACAREAAHPVVWLSVLQAAALIAQLFLLMDIVGERLVLPLALAGLVTSAACEPLLDSALWWARREASRPTTWRTLRVRTSLLGAACALATVVPGVIAALLLQPASGPRGRLAVVFLAAVAITGLATAGCGLQLRTGNAAGSTLVAFASLAVLVLAHALLGPVAGTLVAAAVVAVMVCAVAAHRTSLAANW